MQYVIFSSVLIITLIAGISIGLYLPIFIKKYYKQEEPKLEGTNKLKNITPDIMDEWMNGKGGE